jgi:hypothetical protein
MKYILVAAWLVGPNPVPVPFQAEFSSKESCKEAESALAVEFVKTGLKGHIFSVCLMK